jgi:hypothetical protein
MRSDEIGACRVWMRGDSDPYFLHPEEYPRLREAWMAGRTFFEGRGTYDTPTVLKLAAVDMIDLVLPEGMALRKHDAAEDLLMGE